MSSKIPYALQGFSVRYLTKMLHGWLRLPGRGYKSVMKIRSLKWKENSRSDLSINLSSCSFECQKSFPPREVRDFRVLTVKDVYPGKRPGNRYALLTVWDALSLCHSEDGQAGTFEVGQKFMVTNLLPSSTASWEHITTENSQIFLATQRSSRWTRLR